MDAEASSRRRAQWTANWTTGDGFLLVPAGLPSPIAGSDQPYDFRVHAEHRYLGGGSEPGQVLAFDPADGWTYFVHVASEIEAIWEGPPKDLQQHAAESGIDDVRPTTDLPGWLAARNGQRTAVLGNTDLLAEPGGYGLDETPALHRDDTWRDELRHELDTQRRTKDATELAWLEKAARASAAGHVAAMKVARPGMTEREVRAEIEAAFVRAGGEEPAYATIVATGAHGSVLHFSPTDTRLEAGETVLVDAGTECAGYAGDITRVFPVGARFSPEQRELYEIVLRANEAAIAATRPGTEYVDLHFTAAAIIAEGLVDFGLLRGAPADLVDRDAHALFFPHGIGHLIGLCTHDVGGMADGREPRTRFGLDRLRTDLPVQPGYVFTIEPGIYFIEALLTDGARREKFADAVNWDRVDRLLDPAVLGCGGIRVEDMVAVTEDGCRVMTSGVPKQVAEIEELRAETLR
ncbi:MAG: aminopeptidase P family protein [Planctomycetota bacterium]